MAEDQQGVWSKPYAGLAMQRKSKWMAAVKGWSKYIWDFEAGTKENTYGRYMSYGTLQIYSKGNPISDKANGYDFENGWDWNRMPGATTKHLELSDLTYETKGIHRSFSDQTFLGSATTSFTEIPEGVWGMSLHDTAYDTSFNAKKSVFFFDDVMVLLGSNIKNGDSQNNTETTLFQSSMNNNKDMPIYINSQDAITEYPYTRELSASEKIWMIDPYGNGYYIPNAKGVNIQRNTQNSKDHTDTKQTTGEYTTAWINHGASPENGEYEYAIKVDTTPEEMQDYANNISYEVLQKDNIAHIVKSKNSGTIGYAIFKENQELSNNIIKKTDTPILAMANKKDNELLLNIADPDLRISNVNDLQDSVMHKAKIELNGVWNIEEKNSEVKVIEQTENSTIIEVNCIDGKTVLTKLEQKEEHTKHTGGTATCTNKAICEICEAEYGELNANNHSLDTTHKENEKSATCKETGYTGDIIYDCCNTIKEKGTTIEKLEHKYDEGKITKEATYEQEGEKTYTCTICKETKIEKVPKLNKQPDNENNNNDNEVDNDKTNTEDKGQENNENKPSNSNNQQVDNLQYSGKLPQTGEKAKIGVGITIVLLIILAVYSKIKSKIK